LQKTNELEMIRILSSGLDRQHNLVSARGIKRVKGQCLYLYRFRHVLFQKYLYNRLDGVERVYLHEEIGNVLEKIYGEQTDEIALCLARREFGRGGNQWASRIRDLLFLLSLSFLPISRRISTRLNMPYPGNPLKACFHGSSPDHSGEF
jgi:hypothetical protein